MEIKSIQPTAKFNADLANGQHIELEVAFVSTGLDSMDYIEGGVRPKFSKVVRGLLADALVGWDLTDGGQPIPCDKANRDKYLPILLGLQLKDGGVLGLELMNFASDSENYLKN
jgi:hypothetical protein